MKPIRNPFTAAASAAALLSLTQFAAAANFYWDADSVTAENQNGNGTWNTSNTNWTAAAVIDDSATNIAWVNGENTAFLGNAAGAGYTNPADVGTITLAETISLFSLSMSSGQTGSYVIDGGGGLSLQLVGTSPTIGNNNSTASLTINAVVSGSAGLRKVNAGRVLLTASNTYTGNTTLEAGALDVGDVTSDTLTAGGILFTGGVLQGYGTFTRNFNAGGLNAAADGEIAGASGGFAARDGTLTVNFGNASAQVTLSGPSYRLGNSFILGSTSANNKVTVENPIALNGSVRTFNVPTGLGGDSAELSGVLSGVTTAGLNKTGTGLLTLSGGNTYAGVTTIGAGTLAMSHANALGAAALGAANNTTSVVDGARLQLINGVVADPNESLAIAGTGGTNPSGSLQAGTGGGTWSGPVTLNAAARIGATAGNTLTVTGTIADGTNTGVAFSGQSGTGTIILNPTTSNTYTGQTNLVRGIVRLGKNDALPVTTVIDAKDAANSSDATVLDLASYNQTIAGLFDSGANANTVITNSVAATTSTLTINLTGAVRTYDGTIADGAGAVALTKTGTITQTLTGANSYSGATLINVGAITIANDTALGTTAGATTIQSTGTIATGGRLYLSNGITCAEPLILAGISEQTGGFNPTVESLSGNNTLTGNITLEGTGGQRISSAGSGTLNVNGPIARDGANNGLLVLKTGTADSSMIVNNTIDLNGSSLNIQGLGTVVMNATGHDVGAANISFGGAALTLKLGLDNALPVAADLIIGTSNATAGNDQGILDLAGFNQTVRAFNGIRSGGATPADPIQRKITNSGGTVSTLTAGNTTTGANTSTFDGVIEDGSGGVALTKVGGGTLVLTGPNTYTGATTVSEGTLALVGGSQSSAITVASGAFLSFTLDSPTTSTAAVNLSTGAVKIAGTPTAPSYTLMTASAITGTPVLDAPIAGYALQVVGGNQLQLNAVAAGDTYADWLADNAPATGFVTDSDNDGVSNGVEHVLGTDPNGATAGLTQVSSTASSVTFTHPLNPSLASDVSYGYQWSTDLDEWKASGETNGGGTTATIAPSAPVSDVVTVTTTIDSGPAGKLFLRLQATQN